MKITKGRIRQIIREELARFKENRKQKLAENKDIKKTSKLDSLEESIEIELVEKK